MKMKTRRRKSEESKCRFTRIFRFSSAHCLSSSKLTEEENRKIYGKCSNPFGHGHNYTLEITVTGTIHKTTGRICEPEKLDAVVRREILDVWDHRHLDQEVCDFQGKISTGENIVQIVWEKLSPFIPLACVKLQETQNSWFEYRGSS